MDSSPEPSRFDRLTEDGDLGFQDVRLLIVRTAEDALLSIRRNSDGASNNLHILSSNVTDLKCKDWGRKELAW